VLVLVWEPYLWIIKATIYYPLEWVLFTATDKSCFITLIVNIDILEPYKPRTYREAISGGDIK
jgi:uncharacterized membrane protein (DUF2068 family)